MICKFFNFCLLLFVVLHATNGAPHLYRHHSYYHHRSPYHVNYSPFSLPKRTYSFGAESSFANDLEDTASNDQVKGGVKNSNPNQIKTPMKLFSERKNGYQFGSSLSSLQEKFSEAKRANAGSIKSQQSSPDSVIYPSADSDLNEETANLPVLDLDLNPVKGSTKGSADAKSKVKTKISSQTADAPSPIKPASNESPVKVEGPVKVESPVKTETPAKIESPVKEETPVKIETPTKIETPAKIESPTKVDSIPVKVENSKESSNVNDAPTINESSSDVLNSKVASPSSTEQPATTLLSPAANPAPNAEISIEIKEIKVDNIVKADPNVVISSEANVVKIESNEASKSVVKPEAVKPESVNIVSIVNKPEEAPVKSESIVSTVGTVAKPEEVVLKPESNSPESVVNNKIEKVDAPVKAAEIEHSPVKMDALPASVQPPAVESAPVESSPAAEPILDVRKKPVESEVVNSSASIVATSPEQIVPKPESNVIATAQSNVIASPVKSVSSVDVPPVAPVSANTESSLVLENETASPLIN